MSGENYLTTQCPCCNGKIEFHRRKLANLCVCPHCSRMITLGSTVDENLPPLLPPLYGPNAKPINKSGNVKDFAVTEMRHFVIFTGQDSKYRISRGDLLLLGLSAQLWKTGDVVSLSAQQRVTLANLHKRCLDLGDEGVRNDIQRQNIYGILGWIIFAAIVVVLVSLFSKH